MVTGIQALRLGSLHKGVSNLLAGLMVTAPAFPLFALGATILLYVNPSGVLPVPASPAAETGHAADLDAKGEPQVGSTSRPSETADAKPSPPAHSRTGRLALKRGLVAGVIGWVALGVVAAMLSSVDRANRGVYQALRARLDALEAAKGNAMQTRARPQTTLREIDVGNQSVLGEVENHLKDLRRELGPKVDST